MRPLNVLVRFGNKGETMYVDTLRENGLPQSIVADFSTGFGIIHQVQD